MKTKLFTLFLALVANMGIIYASNTQVNGIWYDFDESNKTAIVTYRGWSYDSYDNEYSGSVVIPPSVSYNGTTYSVTIIGASAFADCSSLTSITIPNSVKSIGWYAFAGCSSLTSINVDAYNSEYSSADGVLFSKDKTTLVAYPGGKQGAYTIPNSVTSIGLYAFYKCSSLTSVTIPNSVTSIIDETFQECSSLTSINIPNSVTWIGDEAFRYCSSLTSVTIPNSVTSIGRGAFCKCSSLTSVTIPNSVTSIGGGAFYNCSSLTSVTIPNSVTSIGESAFFGTGIYTNAANWENDVLYINDCLTLAKVSISGAYTIKAGTRLIADYAFSGFSSLTSITIPNSVTSIGSSAFSRCSSLTSITIPSSVTSIGSETFYECSSLTSITIPNSVTSIGDEAFRGCSSLTSVTIGNSVTSIGSSAFCNCSSLTSINIPNSVTSIGNDAFRYCSSLTSVTIPNSVTSIGDLAFDNCSSLTSVTIPNSVTSIGSGAFRGCSSLTSITIPNSVTSIGYEAFNGCDKLVDVYCYATTPPEINENSFSNYNAFLYIPCENKKAYMQDAVWGNFKYIECISSDNVTTDEIVITPSDNEVNVTWPTVSGAASYELVIKDKDGNIVCTLIFNANGQLISIAFNAPSRNSAPAQTQNAGFSFTIAGLDSGTNYDLTLTAKDNSGNTIEETTIPFHTNWPEGIENVQGDQVQSTKVIKDGQVLILSNGKTYTMQGQEVK